MLRICALMASAALIACGNGEPTPDAAVPTPSSNDAQTPPPDQDAVHVSQLSCEGLETDLLSAAPSRAGLLQVHGEPDSTLTTTQPNRHIDGAVDSLFAVFYPGFQANFRTPPAGRDLIASATITDNRYLSEPSLGIGVEETHVIGLLGNPTRRENGELVYDCGDGAEQPVRFILRDGRVAAISISYYVD